MSEIVKNMKCNFSVLSGISEKSLALQRWKTH